MIADDPRVHKVASVKCLSSLMFFTRYFFKKRFNRKFVIGEHHIKICEALERVYRGECKRLIINVAPRYGKTELAVKNFIADGLALNPSAKFIHLSYSVTLALDNCEEIKDMVSSAEYQQLFPHVQIKKASRAKKKWYTTQSGGVYATSASGQLTGFGARKVDEEKGDDLEEFLTDISLKQGFGGAIIIDDPIKPEDAHSEVRREKVNSRYDSTIKNRVNSRDTPIIYYLFFFFCYWSVFFRLHFFQCLNLSCRIYFNDIPFNQSINDSPEITNVFIICMITPRSGLMNMFQHRFDMYTFNFYNSLFMNVEMFCSRFEES